MSLGALHICAPTFHTQCQWHPTCRPNLAFCLVWKRAEVRLGVPRFSLPSCRNSWDLLITFSSASVGFDQCFREKVTLNFPVREEVQPGSTAFCESCRREHWPHVQRGTTFKLPSMVTTLHLCYCSRKVLQPISEMVCVNREGGPLMAGCPDSLTESALCRSQVLRLKVGSCTGVMKDVHTYSQE